MNRIFSSPVLCPARPPRIAARPSRRVVHGHALPDEFAWLKARNWPKVLQDPAALPADIRQVVEAENRHADRAMRPLGRLRRRLTAELRGRIEEDDSSPPIADGPFEYGERYRKGGQQPIVWRRPRGGGRRRTLLDGDREAHGKPFFDLGTWSVSPDHALLAWASDTMGSEFHTIAIRDLARGADIETIADCAPACIWSEDRRFLFYVALDKMARPYRVMRHELGTPTARDAIVLEETAPGFFIDLDQSQDSTLGLIAIGDHETSETWLIDLAEPLTAPRLVAPRERGIEYHVDRHGDMLVILTNREALDFRIVETPLAATAPENWRDLVAHQPGTLITDHVVLSGHLVRQDMRAGLPRIVIRAWQDGAEETVAVEGAAYDLEFEPGSEYDTTLLCYTYSALTTPDETYDLDLASGERKLVKRQAVPSGHDPERYVTGRLFATGHDGALVPITILHRSDLVRDGGAPLFLEGYGAYGVASMPAFDGDVLSLVDRGFVYAIAHIRGGTEGGWRWYLDGKREHKPNSFHDFLSVARHLAAEGYTTAGRIVATGASAGGMLMGAVANMAPDLFAGIIAEVPFVDVLNTMLDEKLPLTPPEWPEWGNPISDAQAFATILGYSPYDNVAAQAYPAILALGGLADPRVTYWEPLKWVARLRARMTGGGPVLLRTNTGAGHGGESGRFDRLKEIALMQAFAIAVACAPEEPLPWPEQHEA